MEAILSRNCLRQRSIVRCRDLAWGQYQKFLAATGQAREIKALPVITHLCAFVFGKKGSRHASRARSPNTFMVQSLVATCWEDTVMLRWTQKK
jgi:hypothetical protein